MKIKSVKAYQSVKFEGNEHIHLSKEVLEQKGRGRGGKNVSFTEVKGVGIKIKSDLDCIILPFANCACIVLDESKIVESFKSTPNSRV